MNSNLNESLLQFQVKRKHLILDKLYQLFLTRDAIDISPKYHFHLNLSVTLQWHVEELKIKETKKKIIVAFSILWQGKFKRFEANHEDLFMLKKAIRNKVVFSKISDFYKPMQTLGKTI